MGQIELVPSLISYGIILASILVLACLVIWCGRKISVVATFLLYCILAYSMFLLGNSGFFESSELGAVIDESYINIAGPFFAIYNAFKDVILGLINIFSGDIEATNEFLNNTVFIYSLHGGLLLIFLIFFRRKKKVKIDRSIYAD